MLQGTESWVFKASTELALMVRCKKRYDQEEMQCSRPYEGIQPPNRELLAQSGDVLFLGPHQ